MLDQTALRTELANHYDLAPSAELAAAHAGIYSKMERVISPPDWAIFAPYVVAINALKKQRNAVILAHNYMTPRSTTASPTLSATACNWRSRRQRSRPMSSCNAVCISWPKRQKY